MKYWLTTFQTTAGEPVYKKLEQPNKSDALFAALKLADEIPDINKNVVPNIIAFKEQKHDELVEPSSADTEVTTELELPEQADKDTSQLVTLSPTIQTGADVFGFELSNNVATDTTVTSMSDNFLTDTPTAINDNADNKVVSIVEKSESLTVATKKEVIEKPKKAKPKKEPTNYLILPKSEKYTFFPERLDYCINDDKPCTSEIQQAINDINEKIDRLFPGEVLRLEGVPDAVYHATKGIGSTKLKKFADAPAKYKANIQLKSKCLDMGHAVHIRVLQPEIFDTTIACKPPWLSRNTTEYKDIAAAFPGVTFLNECDYNAAIECSDELLQRYGQFFTGGSSEVSYWKRHEKTGLILKARIDYEHESLCVDLKTTVSAGPGDFDRQANKYGYFLQDALYSMVTGIDAFVFVATETSKPYLSTVNFFNEVDRQLARGYCNELLNRLSLCYKTDIWPGYTEADEITQMDLNYFIRTQIENF